MTVETEIEKHIATHPDSKQREMQTLHELILQISPGCKLWFSDGKNEDGKVVSNPSIGYGTYTIKYADGSTKEFFQIGLSANTSGLSIYIMGLEDKRFLPDTFGKTIGKATVTGYCIRFKTINDIDLDVLQAAIKHGLTHTHRAKSAPRDPIRFNTLRVEQFLQLTNMDSQVAEREQNMIQFRKIWIPRKTTF